MSDQIMAGREEKILLPEERLLLLAGRYRGDAPLPAGSLRPLPGEITDWPRFLHLVNEHGVIALTWYNISRAGAAPLLPEEVAASLRNGYMTSLARNSVIYRTLEEVSEIASAHNIKVIPLKGAFLERVLYGNEGLRQMSDLDILVPEADAMRLHNLLTSMGHRSLPFKSSAHASLMQPTSKHLPEIEMNGIYVEIHFRLFGDSDNILTNKLIEESSPSPDASPNTFTPPPHLHLLYLVTHLRHHEQKGESQLRLYNDVAVMLSHYGSDLSAKAVAAGSAALPGIEEIIAETIALATMLSRYDGSPELVSRNAELQRHEERAVDRFIAFLPDPKSGGKNAVPPGLRQQADMVKGSPVKRLQFIAGSLFPSIAWMKQRFGLKYSVTALFYYPVRWIRGLRKTGHHIRR